MITVKSFPLNQINYSITEPASTNSNAMVQNLYINVSQATTDEYIEITFNSVVTTLLITDEYRYTPIDIAFQNKEGGTQIITMFKERKDSTSITSEEYESNFGQGKHQFQRFNVQSRSKFTVNTGFISEDRNETIKQLLYSPKVWVIESGLVTPVNIGTKSLEKKTRLKDKLIDYTLEFEYAFNDINNI